MFTIAEMFPKKMGSQFMFDPAALVELAQQKWKTKLIGDSRLAVFPMAGESEKN